MLAITSIMFVAAILGGIPMVTRSFEVLVVHRALVGLHNGKIGSNVIKKTLKNWY